MTPNASDAGSQDPNDYFLCLRMKSNPSSIVVMKIFSKSVIFDIESIPDWQKDEPIGKQSFFRTDNSHHRNLISAKTIPKMKHSIILLIIVALILLTASCNQECEDFNYDIVQWLPYDENDEILLTNSNFVDTLTVDYRGITHTEEIPRFSLCICENSFIVGMSSDSVKISIMFYDSRNFEDSFVSINDEYLGFHQQLETYEINGKVYSNLLEYTYQNPEQPATYETVIIARSVGIISIIGKSEEWVPVDDSSHEIEASTIRVTLSDC